MGMEQKLRPMNHARLLCLANSAEAPEWFVKLCEGFADSIRRGDSVGLPRGVKFLAQRMWDDIVEGSDPQDTELYQKYAVVPRGTRIACDGGYMPVEFAGAVDPQPFIESDR